MQKISKKLFIAVFTMFLSLFTIGGFINHVNAEENSRTAFINVGGNGWQLTNGTEKVAVVNEKVSGDGQYTVSVDFSETGDSIKELNFLALEVFDGESILSNKVLVIDQFKINGTEFFDEVKNEDKILSGKTYTTSEENKIKDADGKETGEVRFDTRVNISNEWGNVNKGRTEFGSAAVTANAIDLEKVFNKFEGITKIEITFTVKDGIKFDVTAGTGKTVAYINYASADWGVQHWYDGTEQAGAVYQEVTGYGEEYTVSYQVPEGKSGNGFAFFDVEILNGEFVFPMSYMQITSVKINDKEVSLRTTYTSSDNKLDTRTNLFNDWQDDATIKNARTFLGLGSGYITSKPIVQRTDVVGDNVKVNYVLGEELNKIEVSKLEVTFTLMPGASVRPVPVDKVSVPTDPEKVKPNAFIKVDGAKVTDDKVVKVEPTITGYGQYTASLDFTATDAGKIDDIRLLSLNILEGEKYFPNSFIRIDKITINGVERKLGNSFTSADITDTETGLIAAVETKADVDSRVAGNVELDNATNSPLIIDENEELEITTIEIIFSVTVGGFEEYELPTEFIAFLGFNDAKDAWSHQEAGKAGDTKFKGDGKYTVTITKDDVNAAEQAESGRVLTVDIVGLAEAMIKIGTLKANSDGKYMIAEDLKVSVKVWVDGKEINVTASNIYVGDLEDKGNLRIQLHNQWAPSGMEKSAVDPAQLNPKDEIKIEFTITGTGIEGDTPVDPTPVDPTPVDPTPNPTPNPSAPAKTNNTALIIVSIIAAIGVITSAVTIAMLLKKNR
ncbi:hypothetical protein [Haploplasma axanthum]|uniref:Uncharacterized protein n=1 Tax=Haploplasma axanthum TaxID=29552 RepID=A0A449BF96_HAPAX|nr:hypothetical protein [Haploplasma axanthum]VEU81119.1 Uncharacterised protein [Haploplasma axanthum]